MWNYIVKIFDLFGEEIFRTEFSREGDLYLSFVNGHDDPPLDPWDAFLVALAEIRPYMVCKGEFNGIGTHVRVVVEYGIDEEKYSEVFLARLFPRSHDECAAAYAYQCIDIRDKEINISFIDRDDKLISQTFVDEEGILHLFRLERPLQRVHHLAEQLIGTPEEICKWLLSTAAMARYAVGDN